jgi:hypothetical protein
MCIRITGTFAALMLLSYEVLKCRTTHIDLPKTPHNQSSQISSGVASLEAIRSALEAVAYYLQLESDELCTGRCQTYKLMNI